MLRSIGLPELLIVLFVIPCLVILPSWKIFSKAGYPGVLSLLLFIPVLNLIAWLFLAFSDWPVLKELRVAKQNSGQAR